jgi:hypothetical protein
VPGVTGCTVGCYGPRTRLGCRLRVTRSRRVRGRALEVGKVRFEESLREGKGRRGSGCCARGPR